MRLATEDPLSATFSPSPTPPGGPSSVRLSRGAATVKEISAPFEISGPAISRHLRVLERAGLIQRGREAQWRPRTLDASPIREVAEWAGEFRRFWDASYARLDNYLDLLKKEEKKNAKRS
jgi:DNA-binding transcriptional ArsR family regulator